MYPTHGGLLNFFHRICYDHCIFNLNCFCVGLFGFVETADLELDTVELISHLYTSYCIPRVPHTRLLLLIQRYPPNRSPRSININPQIERLSYIKNKSMRLFRKTNSNKLSLIIIFSVDQFCAIPDGSSGSSTVEYIDKNARVRVEDKLGSFLEDVVDGVLE